MKVIEHFELPFEDVERASHFYEHIFGWEINKAPMDDVDYWMVHTSPVDEKNMPTKPGAVNGGMYKKEMKEDGTTVVVTVENLDEILGMVESHGGKVVVPKTQIGKMGLYAKILDTEGNLMGLWEHIKK